MSSDQLKNDDCSCEYYELKNNKLSNYQFYKPTIDKSECGLPSKYTPIYNTTTRAPSGLNIIELENQMRGTKNKLTACGIRTQDNGDFKKVDIEYPEMCGIVEKQKKCD